MLYDLFCAILLFKLKQRSYKVYFKITNLGYFTYLIPTHPFRRIHTTFQKRYLNDYLFIPKTLLELQKNSEEENPLCANEHDNKRILLYITESNNFSIDVLQDIGRWPEKMSKQFQDLVVSQGTSLLTIQQKNYPSSFSSVLKHHFSTLS